MNSILDMIVGNNGDELTVSTLCAFMVFVIILEVISSIAANLLKVGK